MACSRLHELTSVSVCVRIAGQGLNMTMEDAAELAWHVQQFGLCADALERFEAKRLPRVRTILDHAKVGFPFPLNLKAPVHQQGCLPHVWDRACNRADVFAQECLCTPL